MSAHDDYLDPDRYLPPEDYGFDAVREALKAQSTNRWRWDALDTVWTGKDADLDTFGDQGLTLLSVDDTEAKAEVFLSKTSAGTDVALNVPKRASEAAVERAAELYLELASDILPSFSGARVEWDGDSWALLLRVEVKVPVVPNADESDIDAEATASALVAAAQDALKPYEGDLGKTDALLDILAGWKKETEAGLVPCLEGRPGPASVWRMVNR